MKEALHKIVSVAMALLLLLSTTSWKVEKHYCMGRLMDMTLFVDVDNCGMNVASMDSQNLNEAKNSCCSDEVIFVEGVDDLKLSLNDLDAKQQSFLISFTFSYVFQFQDKTAKYIPHEQYPPPILVKDIQLFDEAFLI